MKRALVIIFATVCIILASCKDENSVGIIGGADGPTAVIIAEKGEGGMFEIITPEEAKSIMDSGEDVVILDVREKDEYDSGHVPGAILIPYTEIDEKAEDMLPNKTQQILVYCRSGRRSKIASESLVKMGYTNVKEFGGIIDWPYEVE